MPAAERVLVLWIPDWPIHAHLRDRAAQARSAAAQGLPAAEPGAATDMADAAPEVSPSSPTGAAPQWPALALVANHRVVACSPAARAEGVRAGLREREAQARCPSLQVHAHRPEADAREFAPVLTAIEQLVPGVEPRRPGLSAMRVRGPARYYGGEEPAATALLQLAAELGFDDARVGIADGIFAAEQAARSAAEAPGLSPARPGVMIVPAGQAPAFLSALPVSRAAPRDFAEVLHGLGIHTLGAFAALPEEAVRQRFGANGIAVHRRATAAGPGHGAELRPRTPAREFTVELAFEPPIATAEQLAFACAALAEQFVSGFTAERLVCTALRVELTDDIGVHHEREWAHPRHFTATDVLGRIRWQASGLSHDAERGGAGITLVRLTPTHTDRAAAHEPGLWNTEPDERVHHQLSRAQSRLGHTAVGTMQLGGGRLLRDRQRRVPWGTRHADATGHASAAGPWPGALTGPAPSLVFTTPLPAELRDRAGTLVRVDAEDLLTTDPAQLTVAHTVLPTPVQGWSPPWPLREHWWEGAPPRFRLQVELSNGDAWLLYTEAGSWFAEGRYD